MPTLFSYPNINPIALSIGPLDIRWYGISYVVGILCAWLLVRHHITKFSLPFSQKKFDDCITYLILGIVIGGRLGYVLFYDPAHFLANPLDILKTWQGGMAFHGGLLGVIVASAIFCMREKISLLVILDLLAAPTPAGLFFGRIANFINAEHYGRVTDSVFGMVFPNGGPLPRHPSQLYEAALEGLLLFAVLITALHFVKRSFGSGFMCGLGLAGYAIARTVSEIFREPEIFAGLEPLTYGQLLSTPMFLVGLYLIYRSKKATA